MTDPQKLNITAQGEQEIVIMRDFAAPRHLVFDAFTIPELVKQWLLGPPGWSMPVCEIDLRVGGKYRYVWHHTNGTDMGMGGIYREIVRPERLVTTEKFDEAWYPGEALGTIVLTERSGKTALSQTIRYESRDARDMVLKSPMEGGITLGYQRLADLLAAQQTNPGSPQ